MSRTLTTRGKYQGLVEIFQYNRHLYLAAGIVAPAAVLLSKFVPPGFSVLLLASAAFTAFWACSSLLVRITYTTVPGCMICAGFRNAYIASRFAGSACMQELRSPAFYCARYFRVRTGRFTISTTLRR